VEIREGHLQDLEKKLHRILVGKPLVKRLSDTSGYVHLKRR